MIKNKRAISGVIETILLILLTIIAIALIATFIISFVKKNTQSGTTCIEAIDKVKLNKEYTCYVQKTELGETVTGALVSVETGKINIDKLVITLSGGGKSKSVEIINNSLGNENLSMYRNCQIVVLAIPPYPGFWSCDNIELPKENEGRTYLIGFNVSDTASGTRKSPYYLDKVEKVKINPVINGKQCEGEELDIQLCSADIQIFKT